ncbi:type IV pilin protein [Neisseria dentiae]|uniref:type IV pilin protein n=1 Tax=Neisseria dentiae TaxID=194197 RepID=UPI0035A11806
MKTQQQGFTLIELMIVVLTLAILATIAYPSYETYVRQTRLENVRADLMINAQILERYYAQNKRFPTSAASDPAEVQKITNSLKNDNPYFTISYEPDSNDNYLLRADANTQNANEKRYMKIDGNGVVTLCKPKATGAASNATDECYMYK